MPIKQKNFILKQNNARQFTFVTSEKGRKKRCLYVGYDL